MPRNPEGAIKAEEEVSGNPQLPAGPGLTRSPNFAHQEGVGETGERRKCNRDNPEASMVSNLELQDPL